MAGRSGTEEFAAIVPKAEIHLHLEGSIDVDTLLRLRRERGESSDEGARRRLSGYYEHRDFPHFLENYRSICGEIRRPEEFAVIVAELCDRLARDNVRHAEVMCSALIFTRRGMPIDEIMDAVSGAGRRAESERGMSLRFLFDGVRQWGIAALEELVLMASECRKYGVIGIGVGGDERAIPTAEFRPAFEEARRLGLHTVIHAGEFDGPRSVWEAIDELDVERIGHGVRAVEDDELVRILARRRIPLECCPTSNVRTGVARSWTRHPIRALYDAGVAVTVNSDDPAMFSTSTSGEWRAIETLVGLPRPDVVRIGVTTIEASFLEPPAKQQLAADLRRVAALHGCDL